MNDINCWEEKLELCVYAKKLLAKLELLNQKAPTTHQVNLKEIKKAIYYAKKYHGKQRRLSGEPYYSHPLAVADLVAPYCFKTDILVTSILHDVIEDTILTKEMISKIFDTQVANNVEALTRVKLNGKLSVSELVENLYLLKNHYDLLTIKCFDRLHNMQTLSYQPSDKIVKTVEETIKIFIVISIYLSSKNSNLLEFEQQLAELCYKHTTFKPQFPPIADQIFEDTFLLPFPTFQNDLSQI